MSSGDFSDREELRAIIKSAKDKKQPRTALHRGKFGIMGDKPLLKKRKAVMIGGTIKLVREEK